MWMEFFLEERSAAELISSLLPKILPNATFEIHSFDGRPDLLKKLPDRLKAYSPWDSDDHFLVILVDRDDDDCHELKRKLEDFATNAGLKTLSSSPDRFHVINRIAIEELEAWFFGDIEAMHQAYPRIPASLGKRAPYRDPDAITGRTSKRLEKLLKEKGYHPRGLEKIRAAQEISRHMDPDRNRSKSFQVFCDALRSIPQRQSDE